MAAKVHIMRLIGRWRQPKQTVMCSGVGKSAHAADVEPEPDSAPAHAAMHIHAATATTHHTGMCGPTALVCPALRRMWSHSHAVQTCSTTTKTTAQPTNLRVLRPHHHPWQLTDGRQGADSSCNVACHGRHPARNHHLQPRLGALRVMQEHHTIAHQCHFCPHPAPVFVSRRAAYKHPDRILLSHPVLTDRALACRGRI